MIVVCSVKTGTASSQKNMNFHDAEALKFKRMGSKFRRVDRLTVMSIFQYYPQSVIVIFNLRLDDDLPLFAS